MSGVAPDPLDRARQAIEDAIDAGGDFLNEPVGKAGIAALDALEEVARAARDLEADVSAITDDGFNLVGHEHVLALGAALARLGQP